MKRWLVSCTLAMLAFSMAPAQAAEISVMTQNQYLGADLTPVLLASSEEEFNAAVVSALQTISANRPVERMQALAASIRKAKPAIAGLQEVYRFKCTDVAPWPQGVGCSNPAIAGAFSDQLETTLAELGSDYVEAATVTNLNIPALPFIVDGVLAYLEVVDRDVILARSSAGATAVDFAGVCAKLSGQGCNYTWVGTASTPAGPIAVERGFAAVDVTIEDRAYRIFNTHLESQQPDPTSPLAPFIQSAQALELVEIASATTPPDCTLIILGDMNSAPTHAPVPGPLPLPAPFDAGIPTPYQWFASAGFADTWTLRPGGVVGNTCCQAEELTNHQSALYERIDMIYTAVLPRRVQQARVLAATASDKTSPPGRGLWPSDHGGVEAKLQF